MRCLVIVAHMDDEALSTGGYIQTRVAQGWEVRCLTVFGRTYNYGDGDQGVKERLQGYAESCGVLGVSSFGSFEFPEGEPNSIEFYSVLRRLEDEILRMAPQEVVVPDCQDRNQDHKFLHTLSQLSLRPWAVPSVRRILGCQSPDGMSKDVNYFIPLSPAQVDTKWEAMACYPSEVRFGSHPRSRVSLEAWHRMYGAQCGVDFAEPYRLLRAID